MYNIFMALLSMVWVCDILNMPFVKCLDTTYPLNTLFWLLVWLVLPSTRINIVNKNIYDK